MKIEPAPGSWAPALYWLQIALNAVVFAMLLTTVLYQPISGPFTSVLSASQASWFLTIQPRRGTMHDATSELVYGFGLLGWCEWEGFGAGEAGSVYCYNRAGWTIAWAKTDDAVRSLPGNGSV